MRIGFSGHETFVCRTFWLKKGYDFVMDGRAFADEDAVVALGVGKNMVTSINFWMRGFHIMDRDQNNITDLGQYLFGGRDPFLEDIASLWLLHYSVVKNQKVFIFNSFFNEFTKQRSEFTKEHLIGFLKRKTESGGLRLFSEKTYESDATVFLRTYLRSHDGKADLEDETANLLIELNLLTAYFKENTEGKAVQWFRLLRQDRFDLPKAVLLYAILDRFGGESQTITFNELLEAPDSPGLIFSLSEKGLESQLRELAVFYHGDITFSETAGNQVLQIKNPLDKWTVLEEYYG
ncbi:DUF4007 family protein [Mucilaginibacter glaciei]|uniref:DUF4007 family protein n=1 Tax=Mucilaginibacter glaciei TaxID=2772109 RepID=A0A926NU00_9SPHI|nr:DUF4007 family protein [Mucilaginibacter glaciei]MBD1395238.1 DUF4007 family protein [Mucilaginibacter glaciei]